MWHQLNFGKHNGKSLPQVVFADPDWFFWAYKEGGMKWDVAEAEKVYLRARFIRIPRKDHDAEYLVHGPTGKFGTMQIVPRLQSNHEGGSRVARRLPHIDLAVPREISSYDKLGYSRLMAEVKEILFGNSRHRMTRARCEEFFDDQENFTRF